MEGKKVCVGRGGSVLVSCSPEIVKSGLSILRPFS